jgi:hypothetical protein
MRKSLAERDVTLAIPGFAPALRRARPDAPSFTVGRGTEGCESLVLHWRKADPTVETLPFCPAHLLFLILF